ncbi:MAG: 4-hydroxythreonine-4-phosphate dehydrogenase PdxA [Candidatus Omnitrophota bacterium]
MIKPRLAVTMGDPAGVGPEIIAKALSHSETLLHCQPVIVGSKRVLERAFQFAQTSFPYQTWSNGNLPDSWPGVALFNDEERLCDAIPLAQVDAVCGDCAYAWLVRAIQWAKEKQIDAIVTAPLHKEALNQAGHHYAGHTEILADETGVKDFSLMLISGRFRVTHVTCHVAIKDVSSFITQERVACVIRLFDAALTRIDGKRPIIAVCSLNPHAGEGGLFGREEIDAIRPAIAQCSAEGITAYGPYPPDSIYPQLAGGKFDGVVAMYHDQGHIPFKMSNFAFDPHTQEWKTVAGVNVTLGLPIIRTSVDHGTAFDLAGTGKASERSLLDAIDAAVKLAG